MLANDQSQCREEFSQWMVVFLKSKICDIPSSPLAKANCLEFSWVSLHLVDVEPL